MNGPLSPEELDRAQAYWSGNASNMSTPGAPPPPQDPAAYYGPPPAPPAGPPPLPPAVAARPDVQAALADIGAPVGAGPAMGPPPKTREPVAFERDMPAPPKPREPVAFERGPSPAPAPRGGGGGGAPVNPDPYGKNAANTQYLGTFDAEKDALERKAAAEGDKAVMSADLQREHARRKEEDASIARLHEDTFRETVDKEMAGIRKDLDDVRARKIDPYAGMGATGYAIVGLVGQLVGGMIPAKLRANNANPIAAAIQDYTNRYIDAQKAEIDNAKAGVEGRMNLLKQQVTTHKDQLSAELATRNLLYESMKEELEAEKARWDVPIFKANADKSIAEVDRQQKIVQKALAEEKEKKALAAAGAAASARAQVAKMRQAIYEKVLEATGSPALAEQEADRQTLIQTGNRNLAGARPPEAQGGEPALDKTGRAKVALESHQAKQELDANFAAIENAKKDVKKIVAGGVIGSAAAEHLPRWLPGVEGAKKDVNAREAYNRRVMVAVGAGYKLGTDATEPKNREMIEKFAEPYEIKPNDTEELALQKMQNLQKFIAESAAAKGATPPQKQGTQRFDLEGKPKE